MGSLGLGACLADDMGLGKTIQLLAFLLRRRDEARARDARSGAARRADLGASATGSARSSASRRRSTSSATTAPTARAIGERLPAEARHAGRRRRYGLLRRDARRCSSSVDWSVVALDEAQNIKNAASATARARPRAARRATASRSRARPSRTASPSSGRSSSSRTPACSARSRRSAASFAVPIERYGNDDAADAPAPHRRARSSCAALKSDPGDHLRTCPPSTR